MLGARARAAEYHAAKAATARQQASKDEDEQSIPKPAPVSLSLYAKHSAASKNKGPKNYIPLRLSEEEERHSTGSIDLGSEYSHSPPSQPEVKDPPRPASLPPPQTFNNNFIPSEFERAVQTPYRYREQHHSHLVPLAPRAMLTDDGYPFPPHAMVHPSQYMPPPYQHGHGFPPQQLMPMQHIGWYPNTEQYGTHYSYPDIGMMPMTPLPQPRPPPAETKSCESPAVDSTPQGRSKVQSQAATQPSTPIVGGPQLYVFGPDDLSPTKMEQKHRAREKYFAENPPLVTPTSAPPMRSGSPPDPSESCRREDFMRFLRESDQSHVPKFEPDPRIQNLLIDHSSIVPVRTRGGHRSTEDSMQSKSEPITQRETLILQGKSEADWPYLGQSFAQENEFGEELSTPTKHVSSSKLKIEELIASMRAKDEKTITIRPPPGLEMPQDEPVQAQAFDTEQLTDIQYPLEDTSSTQWLEVRMPNAAEREKLRRVYSAIRESSPHDKYRRTKGDFRDIERAELRKWIDASVDEFENRKRQISQVAEEMENKWRRGVSFRTALMDESEAQQHAGTVKAVGEIMAALSMQSDESNGSSFRGSRPYCQPPEYAIERGVLLGRMSGSTSLFESDNNSASIPAPPRLARDPRFRPQATASKDETRAIPRMFASRRMM